METKTIQALLLYSLLITFTPLAHAVRCDLALGRIEAAFPKAEWETIRFSGVSHARRVLGQIMGREPAQREVAIVTGDTRGPVYQGELHSLVFNGDEITIELREPKTDHTPADALISVGWDDSFYTGIPAEDISFGDYFRKSSQRPEARFSPRFSEDAGRSLDKNYWGQFIQNAQGVGGYLLGVDFHIVTKEFFTSDSMWGEGYEEVEIGRSPVRVRLSKIPLLRNHSVKQENTWGKFYRVGTPSSGIIEMKVRRTAE